MRSRALKNRQGTKKKQPFIGLLSTIAILMSIVVAGVVGVYGLGSSWLDELPDYSDASAYNSAQKTEVYANDGTTLLGEFYIENREPVALDQVSDYVIDGTIATEDERFYEHNGVDILGVGRAILVNATGSSREGASTITQQFVRNTILAKEANDISLKRKVREMYIAIKLEEMYSKDEILLMYLNTINYGSGAYGIEVAAQTYFSKSASELSLAEAATLIGIPQSPTYNNPIDNPDNCTNRRNLVLGRMLSNGYITQEEHDSAVAEDLVLVLQQNKDDGIYLYPYFTSHIRLTLLEQFSETEVFKGGLKVYTTLDPDVQLIAEEAARNKEATMDADIEVALTAIDPNTGYILAMVGGKDFYSDQYNLATQAKRSCGSAFKTFTLIAALEEGVSPSTYISCSAKVEIGDWPVENYGGSEYGTRTIAGAFAVSSNTAFARIITVLGADKVVEVAHRLGVKSDIDSLSSITLGGGVGVSTDEMAGALATVANGGVRHEVTGIARIEDRYGTVIYEADTRGERVLTPEIAHAATEVMKGVITSGTGTAAYLSSGQPIIGKTGTSESWHDSYFIGATPQISVAVWIGAREERKMNSNYRAVSVFSEFIDRVLEGQEICYFPVAEDPEYDYSYSSSTFNVGTGISKLPDKEEEEEEEEEEIVEPVEPGDGDGSITDPVDPVDPVDPGGEEPGGEGEGDGEGEGGDPGGG